MFWPKYLLLALLALPIAELAVFVLVAATIGFGWALLLTLATSCAGALLLRPKNSPGGGAHVARLRVVMGPERVHALQADPGGIAVLLCGILLLIPGFITDVAGLLLLIPALRRALGALLRRAVAEGPAQGDAVVDLKPDEWERVPQKRLDDHGTPLAAQLVPLRTLC